MRLVLITLLLSFSLFLSAEDTIPTLEIAQLEVMGFDELTMSSFQEEAEPLNFIIELAKLDNSGSNLRKVGGYALIVLGVIFGVGALYGLTQVGTSVFKPGEEQGQGIDRGIILSFTLLGTGMIIEGFYLINNKPKKTSSGWGKTKKQKQKDNIIKFEGY